MLEKEFAQRYDAAQESVHAPADVIEAARTLTKNAARPDIAPNKNDANTAASSDEPAKRRTSRPRRARWMMPVAACLAALLVLFGAGSAVLPLMQEQAPVRAYAKTPNLLTAELGDGIVPFALDDHTGMQGWSTGGDGAYTGMQFTLEGENISRVQATISRGELYQLTTRTYDRTTEEGIAALNEAACWKPTTRGTGTYLRDYDHVTPYFVEDGLDKTDPNHKTQLRLIKRIGSTIDMPYEGEPLTFGLWFDEVDFLVDGQVDLGSLDGTELALTIVYENGGCRTQLMTLHNGWFTSRPANTEQGADFVVAEGPYETQPKNTPGHEPYLHPVETLYGEVTSITDQPHPYSLENANASANKAPEPQPVEEILPSYGSTVSVGSVPGEDHVHPTSEALSVFTWREGHEGWWVESYKHDEYAGQLVWSDISAYVTDELPANIDINESRQVKGFLGNFEYMNRCRMRTNGWALTEDGHLNDGNSFVVVNAAITNDSDEAFDVKATYLSTICAIDLDEGTTTFATPGDLIAVDETSRVWDPGYSVHFGPGETIHLEVAFIVDDMVAEAENVNCTFGHSEGIASGEGDKIDLNALQYISLGNLERR